jgi:DNA-binding helix-hairpin-helix protein with protein kinase domain/Flp pilus assembly protein TadD
MSRISGSSQSEVIRPIHGIFHTSQSDIVQLGRRIGTGAEGEVYEIQDKSDLVAKVYHEPPPPEKADKLIELSRLGNERLFNLSAWPVSTLRDAPDGEVAGFVMKKISQAEEVHTLHSPKSRLQKFPEASWAFLIYVAANIARAVAAIHEHGLVIGDVNPKNILVTRKATVYLLDVDSFQFSVEGKTYRCEGGFPEYTPPELQGVAFRDVDRKQEHDSFGLAVVIFQLLFLGRHPYSGRYLGTGEMPLERAIREFRFAYGDDAEIRKMRKPPGALGLDSMPPALVDLFHLAFLTTDRPRPREWIEQLDALAKTLKRCNLHNGHYYYRELSDCPWCGIEKQARVRLFNFLLPGDDTRRGHFRLDEVWNQISRAVPPSSPMLKWEEILKPPILSAEVAAHAQNRYISLILALVFSTAAGLAISFFAAFPAAFFLLILAGLAACYIGKTGRTVTVQLLFQWGRPAQGDPLLEQVHARLQQAEETAQQLDKQYDRECGNSRWSAERDELRNQKETYENLAQIRRFRFQQLEAEAKKNQIEEFLDQFKIDNTEIRGIVPPIKAALLSHGVETAADVTEEVEWIPSVGSAQAQRLLDWRRALEQKFVFDPARGVSPEARIRTERELDALRLRLESDLISGAHSLHRMKQEIEVSRQIVWPALTQAHQDLAQAEKDLKVASKRNPAWLIITALVIMFFIGLSNFSRSKADLPVPNIETPRENPGPRTLPDPVTEDFVIKQKGPEIAPEALNIYHQGLALSQAGKFAGAVKLFQEAVRINPQFNEAYEELGYALYRLGRYEESVNASKQAIIIRNSFKSYYNLGVAYMALKQWNGAKAAFQWAISYRSYSLLTDEETLAYYYLGLSKARLGEARQAIADLEGQLESAPNLTVERLELGILYLCIGNQKAARTQYRILKDLDPELAKQLLKLIRKHGKQG